MKSFRINHLKLLLICSIALLSACGGAASSKRLFIASDPTWKPLPLEGFAPRIEGFTIELLDDFVATLQQPITLLATTSEELVNGLEKDAYQAILSSVSPTLVLESRYKFSEPYLSIGPVVVVAVGSTIKSLSDLRNLSVGVETSPANYTLVDQAYPSMITPYNSMPQALADLAAGKLDAVVMAALPAQGFCNNLYRGILQVATPPLTDAGLRLITKKEDPAQLVEQFNAFLKNCQQSSSYPALLSKWQLK